MSHLPFFPAEGSKGCEIEEIRDPRDGYTHAKGQQIFTDLESSGHGKKDVGTLVSYLQDEGKTFPCKNTFLSKIKMLLPKFSLHMYDLLKQLWNIL